MPAISTHRFFVAIVVAGLNVVASAADQPANPLPEIKADPAAWKSLITGDLSNFKKPTGEWTVVGEVE